MGVLGEVVEHVGRAAEWGLGVDDPRVPKEGAQPRAESALGVQALEVFGHREPPRAKGRPETRDKFSAKHATEDLHRQKERRARRDPPRPVGREPARGHDAVDVGMV